ncbi:MAG: phosphate/phosphite/phosphonate ABC transporter substrate-binding protein [Pseudobdellovibrio sp.]
MFKFKVSKDIVIVFTVAISHIFSANGVYAQSEDNSSNKSEIVFSFQKQKNPEDLKKATEKISEQLTKELGQTVNVLIPTSYGATAQGLISKKIQVAYMDSLPFILASKEADLEVILVEKRQGKTWYNSVFVVAKDSKIKSLKDLKGQRIAFSSQTSTSGYLFPFKRLLDDKLIAKPEDIKSFFSQVIYAGGYDKALMAVVNGQADVAAVSDYAIEGAKADLYLNAEQRSHLKVLDRTQGVPTHLIAVSKSLDPVMRKKIQKALLDLSTNNPELLSSVYGAAEFSPGTKNHTEKTLQALKRTDLSVQEFVK